MYLSPLNCFLHDPLPETAHPVYDATPGSAVVYVGEDRKVVREVIPDDEDDEMHGRIRIPLLELGVQELATLSEALLLAAAEVNGELVGGRHARGPAGCGSVDTKAGGRRIVTGEPDYVGRLTTKGGKSGLLIYNVGAVQFAA